MKAKLNISIKLIALMLFVFSGKLMADDDPGLITEKNFSTYGGLTLNFKGLSGDLEITTWSKNEVDVKVYGNSEAKDNTDFEILDNSAGVSITEKHKHKDVSGRDIKIKYKISIPGSYNLNIKTASGDLKTAVLNGNVNYKTASGDASVKVINGDINIASASGDMDIESVNGNVDLSSASGDILCKDINGNVVTSAASGDITIKDCDGEIKSSTASGDIRFFAVSNTSEVNLTSVSGEIIVRVAESSGAGLNLTTMSGEIDVPGDFNPPTSSPTTTKDNTPYHYSTQVYEGGNVINCTTTSGDIRIEMY